MRNYQGDGLMRKIFRTLCILLTLFLVLSVNVPISYAESSKKP